MREVFQQELREVQDRLVEISGLVADSIETATEAFNTSNVALAETVIADDDKIDALSVQLDELAIQILARQQPVARDLRIVVSALRISSSLERMGDITKFFPRKRLGEPEQMDSTLLYLVSPESEAVTGTVIKIDDGLVGFTRRQGLGMFVAVAVGEVEQADGDAG